MSRPPGLRWCPPQKTVEMICATCTMNRIDEIDRQAYTDWWVDTTDPKNHIYYCSDHFPVTEGKTT